MDFLEWNHGGVPMPFNFQDIQVPAGRDYIADIARLERADGRSQFRPPAGRFNPAPVAAVLGARALRHLLGQVLERFTFQQALAHVFRLLALDGNFFFGLAAVNHDHAQVNLFGGAERIPRFFVSRADILRGNRYLAVHRAIAQEGHDHGFLQIGLPFLQRKSFLVQCLAERGAVVAELGAHDFFRAALHDLVRQIHFLLLVESVENQFPLDQGLERLFIGLFQFPVQFRALGGRAQLSLDRLHGGHNLYYGHDPVIDLGRTAFHRNSFTQTPGGNQEPERQNQRGQKNRFYASYHGGSVIPLF